MGGVGIIIGLEWKEGVSPTDLETSIMQGGPAMLIRAMDGTTPATTTTTATAFLRHSRHWHMLYYSGKRRIIIDRHPKQRQKVMSEL